MEVELSHLDILNILQFYRLRNINNGDTTVCLKLHVILALRKQKLIMENIKSTLFLDIFTGHLTGDRHKYLNSVSALVV